MITAVNQVHTAFELAQLRGDMREAERILYSALEKATEAERPALERLLRSTDEMGQGREPS